MNYLKQGTAAAIGLGPFVDAADGVTPETGLAIAQADVRLKKNGGAWAQKTDAASATHEENGWYEVSLDATDTDTLGVLLVAVYVAGALPVWREFTVLAAAVFDALIGVGDLLTEVADAVLDEPVEGSVTLRESARLSNATLGGKASGLGTSTATFRDLADTTDRIVATVDTDGNRSVITRDLT